MSTFPPSIAETLWDVLLSRVHLQGDDTAFTFLEDDGTRVSVTYRELERTARRIASRLRQWLSPGDRALLVYPAGLDFLIALFGCFCAGIISVPATYPRPRRPSSRLTSIVRDSGAAVALTNTQTLQMFEAIRPATYGQELEWLAIDSETIEDRTAITADSTLDVAVEHVADGRDAVAFLQYTSGSTTDPKGVMVTHGNLLHNLEMIRQAVNVCGGSGAGPAVFWLPAYHDMGLIGGILEPLYVGRESVLMSPQSFLRRPLDWLRAVSEFRASGSGAPNFAYDLCVEKTTPAERAELDLSNWQIAFCGAEPVRATTLERFSEAFAVAGFRPEAFYPCYGLAEATLLATGPQVRTKPVIRHFDRDALTENQVVPVAGQDSQGNRVVRLVGCGGPSLGQEIRVVDPNTCRPAPTDQVGEIWMRGTSVTHGYWNRPAETDRTFRGRLVDDDGDGCSEGTWLRTGDLGLYHEGQLYITGRLSERVIVRGRNHYPQDIEATASTAHPALISNGGCAFAVLENGSESIVIVQEVERQHRRIDVEHVARQIKRRVAQEHELDLAAIVFVRQASLPRTTSGKIQRARCRRQYLAGELKRLAEWPLPNIPQGAAAPPLAELQLDRTASVERLAAEITDWLLAWIGRHTGTAPEDIAADRPFFDFGLDSIAAVELSQQLEDQLGLKLPPIVAWNYPTPAAFAAYVAGQFRQDAACSPATCASSNGASTSDVERLLKEIESFTEAEAEAALDSLR